MSQTPAAPAASNAFVLAHLVGCSVAWGMGFMLIKLIGGELPVPVIAAMRASLAAAVLIMAVIALRQSPLPRGREMKDWLVLGSVNGWAPNMLVAYALLHMDSGPAALIQASGPLMTALLAHVFLAGERLTAARVVGIAVGVVGVTLLIGPKALEGGGTTLAILAMLLLTLGYAVGNVYARTIPAPEPIRMALGQQVVSGLFGAHLAFVFVGPAGFANVPAHAWTLAALGLLGTAVPIWLFMRLITAAGPTKAAMTGYLVPATAVILGVIVLGEPVVPRQILGGLIVLLGVAIVTGLVRLPVRRPA